jgi:hypothetical protein
MLPQGLWGEFRMISRVRSVTREASSSGSMRKPCCSRSGTGTGRAPAKAAIDAYIGNPGSG